MKWLKKYQCKTWFGELCGNIFSLVLSLAFISFLNIATEGTIIAIAATSFLWSWRARWDPFRSGFIPALVATSLLQLLYFVTGADMIALNIMITMFIGNLILISALAGSFSLLGRWFRNRKLKKEIYEKQKLEEKKSTFSDNLKRLAILTLFFYIQMFIVAPMAAKVNAETSNTHISSDDLIENFDPENTYSTTSKWVNQQPKRHIPLESPYANITGEELEQLEAYCLSNGCNLNVVGTQLSQMRLKGIVSIETYIALLNKTYAPRPVTSWQNSLILPKVVKSINNKVTQKKVVNAKAAKKGNRPWYQKAWDGAKRFGEELDNKMINEPTKFIKDHPWQAAGIAVASIGLIAASVVFAPVGAALGVMAVISAGISAYGVGKAYYDGGWNGVMNNVFSKETISMAKSGDIGGAAGRGVVEFFGKGLEMIPIFEAPKAAVTAVKGVEFAYTALKVAPALIESTVSTVKAVGKIRVGIAIVGDLGILNSGGVKVLKTMAKDANETISSFVKGLPQSPGALAVVNNSGKQVIAAGKGSESILAEKKAIELAEIVTKEEKGFTPLSQDKMRELPATPRDLHKVQFTNESYKLKADISIYKEGAVQHVLEGEINGEGNVSGMHVAPKTKSSPGRVTHNASVGDNEVFEGTVELYGKTKITNSGKSSFFPKSWDNEKVIEEINSAFHNPNKTLIGNKTRSLSNSGIEIEMIIDPNTSKIVSAYPLK